MHGETDRSTSISAYKGHYTMVADFLEGCQKFLCFFLLTIFLSDNIFYIFCKSVVAVLTFEARTSAVPMQVSLGLACLSGKIVK
jgi:hypothetical protein